MTRTILLCLVAALVATVPARPENDARHKLPPGRHVIDLNGTIHTIDLPDGGEVELESVEKKPQPKPQPKTEVKKAEKAEVREVKKTEVEGVLDQIDEALANGKAVVRMRYPSEASALTVGEKKFGLTKTFVTPTLNGSGCHYEMWLQCKTKGQTYWVKKVVPVRAGHMVFVDWR